MKYSEYEKDFLKLAKNFENVGLKGSIQGTKDCLFYAKSLKEIERFLETASDVYQEIYKIKSAIFGAFNYTPEGSVYELKTLVQKSVKNTQSYNFFEMASYDTGINPRVIFDVDRRGDINKIFKKAIEKAHRACKEIDEFYNHLETYKNKYLGFKHKLSKDDYHFKLNNYYYKLKFSHIDMKEKVIIFKGSKYRYSHESMIYKDYENGKIKSPTFYSHIVDSYALEFDSKYCRKFYPELSV